MCVFVHGRIGSANELEIDVLEDEGFAAGALEVDDGAGVLAHVGDVGDLADAELAVADELAAAEGAHIGVHMRMPCPRIVPGKAYKRDFCITTGDRISPAARTPPPYPPPEYRGREKIGTPRSTGGRGRIGRIGHGLGGGTVARGANR